MKRRYKASDVNSNPHEVRIDELLRVNWDDEGNVQLWQFRLNSNRQRYFHLNLLEAKQLVKDMEIMFYERGLPWGK